MILPYDNSTDEDAILTIWLSASIAAHHFIPSYYWYDKLEDMKKIYLPNSTTYVYKSNDEIKGFLSLVDNYIAALFIDPKYQGNGIGTQLLNFAKNSHSILQLNVYKENESAIAFYLAQGFIIIEEKIEQETNKLEYLMQYN